MKKILTLTISLLLIISTLSAFLPKVSAPDYPHDPRGEITDIEIYPSLPSYKGETPAIWVEFHNPTATTYHYLVVVNLFDPIDPNPKYDSHVEGEDIDGYVGGGETVAWGPFEYTLPYNAEVGTWHILAGLRLYPWEPELDYMGLDWCEPEKTFEVKPSHETMTDVVGGPYDYDGDSYYDSVWIEVEAETNAEEEVDVEAWGNLTDPDGNVVDTDSSGVWAVPAGGRSWGFRFYLDVPGGSPVGRYQVDLYLYDDSHRNNYPDHPPEHIWINAYSYDPLYPPGYQPNDPPILSSGSVTPPQGDTSTLFEYSVHYDDPDDDPPSQREICIDGDSWHEMTLESGPVYDGTYKYWSTLSEGSHTYLFKFRDGVNPPVTDPPSGTHSGPYVKATLTVSSAHDSPVPDNGDHYYDVGESVTCSVSSPVTEDGTVWTCTGWSGMGSVPSSGDETSVGFTITQDSSIIWHWTGESLFSINLRTETTDGQEDINNDLGNTMIFDSALYMVPDTASETAGTYTAQANPPGSYSFHHWECSDGVSVSSSSTKDSNPAQIDVDGDGELKAVFFYDIRLVFSVDEDCYPVEGLSYDGDSDIKNNYINYDEALYPLSDLDLDGTNDVLAYIYRTDDGSHSVLEYWIYYPYDDHKIEGVPLGIREHDFESVYLWIDSDYCITKISLNQHLWANEYWTAIPKTIYIGVEEGGHGMLMLDINYNTLKPDNSNLKPSLEGIFSTLSSETATLYPWKAYTGSHLTDGFGNPSNLMMEYAEPGPFPYQHTLHLDQKIFFPMLSLDYVYIGYDIMKSLTQPILLISGKPRHLGVPGANIALKLYMTAPWVRREFSIASQRTARLSYDRWIAKTFATAFAGWVGTAFEQHYLTLVSAAIFVPADYFGIINDPANVTINDSEGHTLGFKDGELVSEIPGGVVFAFNHNYELYYVFNNCTDLRYSIRGQTYGIYNFTVLARWFNETVPDLSFNATDIPLEAEAVHAYMMDWGSLAAGEDGTTVSVDCDGDGAFDQMWQTGITLAEDQMLRAHNLDTDLGFATIQEAINNPATLNGHIVSVDAGIYYENLVVNKSLCLIGEDRCTTIIDGNGTGTVVIITVNGVILSGFTTRNSGTSLTDYGIHLNYSNNSLIHNNIVTNNTYGIHLDHSSNSQIHSNIVTYGEVGINLKYSSYNNLSSNEIVKNNQFGIRLVDQSHNNIISYNNVTDDGIGIACGSRSDFNGISNNDMNTNQVAVLVSLSLFNNISNNNIMGGGLTSFGKGIEISDSSYNNIWGNNIANNWIGTELRRASYNRIFHNDFVENFFQLIILDAGPNTQDDGYPFGGNYWSDYTGVDLYWGSYQNLTGSDGIGDTPYVIDENNQDNYPLMSPYDYWSNPITGDINKDTKVDIGDLFQLAVAYGSTEGEPNWNPNCDINGDSAVDASDLSNLGNNYGETAQTIENAFQNFPQAAIPPLCTVVSMLALVFSKRKTPRKLKT